MLLCVVVVFIVCNVLPLASNVYENFQVAPPVWIVQSGNLLVTINSSVNFIVYVIFGRKFKRIFLRLFCSSKFFGPGRDSPEFQTNDESVVTNTTNIELRNSIRRSHHHLNRSNTILLGRNNNVHFTNGGSSTSTGNTRHHHTNAKPALLPRSASPGPCVYYPARSPSEILSRTSSAHNGWTKKNHDIAETALQ